MHQATTEKFKTAALFDVGKYELPENMIATAKKAFIPVFDKMMSFAAKYPRKQLQAAMVVLVLLINKVTLKILRCIMIRLQQFIPPTQQGNN